MPYRVLAAVLLALGIAGAVPADAQAPPATRVWTQVGGIVESIDQNRLTLKTDTGGRLRVDVTSMGAAERAALARGSRITLVGYAGAAPGDFVAWFIPPEREEPTAQASPPTAPAGTPAPATVVPPRR
jgi:hypothetical protein